jgi:hypothetical protein
MTTTDSEFESVNSLCITDLYVDRVVISGVYKIQDLLHFPTKEQFDEAEPATLNGLDQPEQASIPIPQLPQETPPSLEQEPETHTLHLQPQQEESLVPTQTTLTADDMRRAKRIRVSGKCAHSLAGGTFLFLDSSFRALRPSLMTIHFEILHLPFHVPLLLPYFTRVLLLNDPVHSKLTWLTVLESVNTGLGLRSSWAS